MMRVWRKPLQLKIGTEKGLLEGFFTVTTFWLSA
jgi:hypothetical protein